MFDINIEEFKNLLLNILRNDLQTRGLTFSIMDCSIFQGYWRNCICQLSNPIASFCHPAWQINARNPLDVSGNGINYVNCHSNRSNARASPALFTIAPFKRSMHDSTDYSDSDREGLCNRVSRAELEKWSTTRSTNEQADSEEKIQMKVAVRNVTRLVS